MRGCGDCAGGNGFAGGDFIGDWIRSWIGVFADDGPVVAPGDGFEMNDAAMGAGGLEMQEEALAIRGFDVGSP